MTENEAKIITLDDVFSEARKYGGVGLHTNDDGRYWSVIKFQTMPGCTMDAKHSGYTETPIQSLLASIEIAKNIVASMKKTVAQIEG